MRVRHRSVNRLFRLFAENKEGATAIEYGLIVGLLAIAVAGSLTSTSGSMKDAWTHIETEVNGAMNNTTP
ncbi:MAG: Flp family type IVb pilin [Parvularculaceae bacterium]